MRNAIFLFGRTLRIAPAIDDSITYAYNDTVVRIEARWTPEIDDRGAVLAWVCTLAIRHIPSGEKLERKGTDLDSLHWRMRAQVAFDCPSLDAALCIQKVA